MSINLTFAFPPYIRYFWAMQRLWISLLAFFISASAVSAADKPEFRLPIDCTPGQDCWLLNYVDMDPADNAYKDPMCADRGYDGHKGTDIAIRSKAEMDAGVNVLAAMDGTVEKIRDGEDDAFKTPEDIRAVQEAGKDCGNAVLIDHGNALKTMYCHMKKGSVLVQPGQDVKAGDPIGQVGLSGVTQFPHVHFGILWEGAIMDPFTGQSNTQGCGTVRQSLWHPDLHMQYIPTDIYHAGFSTNVPTLDSIDNGEQPVQKATADAKALVFWSATFGIRENDRIDMVIKSPSGTILAQRSIEQPKTRARVFYYIGKNLEENPLAPGTYLGEVTVYRKNPDGTEKTFFQTRTIEIN